MNKYLVILFISVSIHFCNAQQQDGITIGRIDSIYSEILKEQRKIWIYLPESSDAPSKAKYPVLYLLDGDAYFHSLSGIVRQLSSFGTTILPESVVIGIPNTNRSRDLMPHDPKDEQKANSGAEKFTAFLEKELIPYIDTNYPVLPHRTLIGHSYGGSFVINTMTDHQNLFANYLAIDPGLKSHDYRFREYAISTISEGDFERKSLFVGVANTMPEGWNISKAKKDTTWKSSTIRSNLKFVEALDNTSNNRLNFKWTFYPNENHLSVPTIASYEGLKYFFGWNLLDLDKIIRSNPEISGEVFLKKVTEHYRNTSEKLEYKILPKEGQVNDLGYYFLQKEDLDGAFRFFELNIENYANSSGAYDSMGDYYLAKNLEDKAAEMFKKAIEIDGNPYSTKKLKELNEKATHK